ncbi:MAG: leucine-rich repeat protein [Butyrivibrio sp.]|nr:leucine-rich repeat protein [Butyrivibrio sp.]
MKVMKKVRRTLPIFLTLALVISFLIPGKLINSAGVANAAGQTGRRYVGGLAKMPEPKNLGGSELPEDYAIPKNVYNATSFNGEHYSYLDSDQKQFYQLVYNAVSSGKYLSYKDTAESLTEEKTRELALIYNVRTSAQGYDRKKFVNNINIAWSATYYDNPAKVQYYMCFPIYDGYFYRTVGNVTTYYDYFVLQAQSDEKQFNKFNNQIITGLNTWLAEIRSKGLIVNGSDPLSKAATERNIHDYYAGKIPYDEEDMAKTFNLCHTAWGSLYNRYAVCDGYSNGYMMIMDALGIDTMVVNGSAGSSGNRGGHAWNIVYLGGYWYEVDTTWAIPTPQFNYIFHDWFNKATAEYNKDHFRDTDYSFGYELPDASGTTYTNDYIEANVQGLYHYSYVPATGISASLEKTVLEIGDELEVKATVTPANANQNGFTVKSSNTNVVSVFGNMITAKAPGTATITVKSVDTFNNKNITTTIPVSVIKASGESVASGGYNYSVVSSSERTVEITGGGNKNAKNITIPSTITDENGVTYTVVKIRNEAFKNYKKLKKLVIPETVKEIGKKCCKNCKKLKSVKIYANNLSKVGSGAFKNTKEDGKITVYVKNKKTYNKIVKKLKKSGAKTQTYKYKKKK